MLCKICGQESSPVFSSKLLNKYIVAYFHCPTCGFLQTEDPYWLKEAYNDPINNSDTGYVSRNLSLARKTFILFLNLFNKHDKFLDYAGGYGLMTRLLRDWGLDYYWNDKYTKNIFSEGFAYSDQKICALSCFECFEHFIDPNLELEKMLAISSNIFFSTTLIGSRPPDKSWWYYGLNHGQHISFYSLITLQYLADKYNLNLCSNGNNLHLFTKKKMSNFYFKLIMKLGIFPWEILFKIFLPSRTMTDHDYIVNRLSIK